MTKKKPLRSDRVKQLHSDASNASPATSVVTRRTPFWQALVLPIISILVFFLFLEVSLTLLGISPALKEDDPFVGFASYAPLFVPTPGPAGQQWLSTASNKRSFFNQQSFTRKKAPGTYRIFSLGGSTTYGHPYDDATSFSGWLRELLPLADHENRWEVVNAGGISYASYRVAHLMEELVAYEPDLFIIYTGHNEFLEERTYRQIREIPPLIRSTASLLAETRTWSAMTSALKKLGLHPAAKIADRDTLSLEVSAVLDQTAGLERYSRDDQLRGNILHHFRVSLVRMVELARSAGAKVIFVTPASNLIDCSPFKSEHTAELDQASRQRSELLLTQAKEASGLGNWQRALELLETATALDPRHAELQYRRGQALLALGRSAEAETTLQLASDEDVCPLRALTPMRRIVTEVAAEEGVSLVDYVELIRQRAQELKGYPIPGEELFLDHVHPTIAGYELLAVALLEEIIRQGLVKPGPDWGDKAIAAVAAKIEAGVDRESHGRAMANLARVLFWAKKNDDAARAARQAQEIAGDIPQVAADSASILSSIYSARGEPEQAVAMLHSVLEKVPGAIEAHLKLGTYLLDKPFLQPEAAAAHLLLVRQQMPQYDMGHAYFGVAMARSGRLLLAYESLTEALRLNPKNAMAQKTLAWLQPRLGVAPARPQSSQITLGLYPTREPYKLAQGHLGAEGRFIAHGIQVELYQSGRIKRFLDLDRGQPNGLELTWSPDGKLLTRKSYRQGVPVGQ